MQSSKLNTCARAQREFDRLYGEALTLTDARPFSTLNDADQKEWWRRSKELHPSSFPYCPLRHMYEKVEVAYTDFVVQRSFGSDYILGNGTLIHSTLQQWLGSSLKIVGNWKCKSCGHVHRHTTKPKKGVCIKCKSYELEYLELGGRYGKHVDWHTDSLWRDANGNHWQIDFKSTSSSRIDEHKKTGNIFPYAKNVLQVESYIPMTEALLGITIFGTMLVYCARDFPQFKRVIVVNEFDEDRRKAVTRHLKRSDRIYARTLEKPTSKLFDELNDHKLCPSRRYYESKVADEFSPCPLCKVCHDDERREKTVAKSIRLMKSRKENGERDWSKSGF